MTQVTVAQGDGASSLMSTVHVKSPICRSGESILEAFFSQVHPEPSTGNQKGNVDEDTPAGTSCVWKEVLDQRLGAPVQHT